MKRWVIIIVACILFGVILNVTAAWWFAVRLDEFAPSSDEKIGVFYDGPGYVQWHVDTIIWPGCTWSYSQSFGRRLITGQVENEISAHEALPYWAEFIRPNPDATEPYTFHWQHAVAYGWPLRSMLRSWHEQEKTIDKHSYSLSWNAPSWIRGEQTSPTSLNQPVYLPLKIIWPGFIANTLLYAMTPLLIYYLPIRIRSYLRFKRKQCTKCGYPIGQSEVCTECGVELKVQQ